MENEESTLRILLATDNHLGYLERDPIRGEDSMIAFEEVLQIAQEKNADMVLLGGDLFHDNRPSRKTLNQTFEIMRRYCFGGKPSYLELLSDQSVNFPNRFATANYLDPNFNISMPIFSIHGNHDDPNGDGNLGSLDLLSTAGYINYFGKCQDFKNISISPLLLRKGDSHIAIYGLGNIRDERLYRCFEQKKVEFLRPIEDQDKWFNILTLHQNRVPHGPKNYIPESFLDDFFHFILWGHEHECLVDPMYNSERGFHVSQPGSSVATSLCEGESKPKHVALLKIEGTEFQLEKIRLKSVRPFVMEDIVLEEIGHLNVADKEAVKDYLTEKVNRLILQAETSWKRDNREFTASPPLPLVRLRVDYTGGFTTFNPQRFGQQFVNRVANPKDVIVFHRKREKKANAAKPDIPDIDSVFPEKLNAVIVGDLIMEYLGAQKLTILPEEPLSDAVRLYVDKDDRDAINDFYEKVLARSRVAIVSRMVNDSESNIDHEIQEEKERQRAQWREWGNELISRPVRSYTNDEDLMEEGQNNSVISTGGLQDEVSSVSSTPKPSRKRKAADTKEPKPKRVASSSSTTRKQSKLPFQSIHVKVEEVENSQESPVAKKWPPPRSSRRKAFS